MRQIAEFIAVLSCSLFTGAAVYVNLVEHSATMQCGVEIAATEFLPSYRRATVIAGDPRSVGSAVRDSRLARRSKLLVAGCRSAVRVSHSVHAHCDLAHKQAIAESNIG
ncbi:MAG TPA: hypothetical protein VGS27_35105 [Candidatus Sulfotelmatobacter sp.]|nr:hypothetical protein [Candidatus Sulfotelmatobacter sp.]